MKRVVLFCLILTMLTSCKKEMSNVYEINPVDVRQSGAKGNLKSDLQFISIAYSDLFGKQISTSELNGLVSGYKAMGDKTLIIDLIIRNLLIKPGVVSVDQSSMQSDPESFIKVSFERFFVREPTEMETWFFANLINENSQFLPEDIYYALMRAEEYRYY